MKDSAGNWTAEPPTYDPIIAEGMNNFYIFVRQFQRSNEFWLYHLIGNFHVKLLRS